MKGRGRGRGVCMNLVSSVAQPKRATREIDLVVPLFLAGLAHSLFIACRKMRSTSHRSSDRMHQLFRSRPAGFVIDKVSNFHLSSRERKSFGKSGTKAGALARGLRTLFRRRRSDRLRHSALLAQGSEHALGCRHFWC